MSIKTISISSYCVHNRLRMVQYSAMLMHDNISDQFLYNYD